MIKFEVKNNLIIRRLKKVCNRIIYKAKLVVNIEKNKLIIYDERVSKLFSVQIMLSFNKVLNNLLEEEQMGIRN